MWREELEFASVPKKRFVADLVRQIEQRVARAKEEGLLENARFSVPVELEGKDDSGYTVVWSGEPATPLISGRLGEWPWSTSDADVSASPSASAPASTLTRLARWGEQAAETVAWCHERGQVLEGPTVNSFAVRVVGGDHGAETELIITDPGVEPFLGAYRHGHIDPRHFTPPEVLKGKAWEAPGDVFALGVSLFYLFSGHLPFADAEGVEQVAENIVERPPASLRAFNPDASPALERFLARLLSKEPNERPKAAEVASELARMREAGLLAANEAERQAAAKVVSQEKRRQQVTRVRRRVRWYWSAAVLVLAAVGIIYWLSRPAPYVPAIGPNTTAEQVVRIYYQAMADLDTRRMEEAIDAKAGRRMIDWVSQLYVIQRMNDAMQMQSAPLQGVGAERQQQGGGSADGEPAPSSNLAANAPRKIVALENLKIRHEGSEGGSEFFTASYRVILYRGENPEAQKRVDHLRLERVEGKWKIVELKQEVYDEVQEKGGGGSAGDGSGNSQG